MYYIPQIKNTQPLCMSLLGVLLLNNRITEILPRSFDKNYWQPLSFWLYAKVKGLTCDFILHEPTVSWVQVGCSQSEQSHRLLVFWHFKTVIHSAKSGPVVILIQHCDTHCGLGKVRRKTAVFGINCLKQRLTWRAFFFFCFIIWKNFLLLSCSSCVMTLNWHNWTHFQSWIKQLHARLATGERKARFFAHYYAVNKQFYLCTCHSVVLFAFPVQGPGGWYNTCHWVDGENIISKSSVRHDTIAPWNNNDNLYVDSNLINSYTKT